ncbi:MAG: hypothetical protein ACXWUN_11995, partial [Allosphingosinicella sp.]
MPSILTRRAFLGCSAAAVLLPRRLAAQATDPVLDELVARNTAARGGAEALDRVHSCLIELDISEGGQTIQGRYAAHAAGLVRIDIYAGGNLVYREGVDRAGVWLWPGDAAAPRPSTADGAANALLHGAENHLFGLHRFRERSHALRLMPRERIDGVEHPVIEIAYRTGHRSYFYLDPSTWQFARRRDERAYHPDVDTTRQRVETRFSDLQTVDGVVAAHRNVDIDLATGAVLATNQVNRRALNPPLPENVFDRNFGPIPA